MANQHLSLPLSPLPCVMFVCKRICFIAISLSPIASASNSSFQFSDNSINVGSFEWLTRVSESEMDGIYPSPTRYRLSTRAQWADNADIADIGRWEIRRWDENEGRIRCQMRSGCGSPLSCPCTSSSSHDGTATGHRDTRTSAHDESRGVTPVIPCRFSSAYQYLAPDQSPNNKAKAHADCY